jgi:hypothetical protein
VGQSGVTVIVAFTPATTLATADVLVIKFPYWNENMNTRVYPIVGGATPVCTAISGMSATLSCTYNNQLGNMQVSNLVSAPTSGT